MRQGCRQVEDRSPHGGVRQGLACALAATLLAFVPWPVAAQPSPPPALAPGAAATGPGTPVPYWQAPALPTAVIQGGAIPSGWTPQPVPYQGVGPDGKPITRYFAPTYTFTYPIGPPVPAVPGAGPVPINRRQAPSLGQPTAYGPRWNYQTQGVPPPAYALPPATTARYAPQPYRYPPGAPQLNGTAIAPPAMPAAPATPVSVAAPPQPPPGFQPLAPAAAPVGQPFGPPPSSWVPAPSASPPPPGIGTAVAAVAPPALAGAAAATAAQQSSAVAATSPAAPVPVQPASSSPLQPPAGRSANSHRWRVVGVYDGDTVTCLDENNQQQRIRLAEIDAPEMGQDFGQVARDALADQVFGKTVEFRDDGKDRYGRWIGHLFVDGVDVNRRMIATGNAWHYAAYSKDASLAAAQEQAKAQRLGLWAQPNPMPPWEFRATQKARKSAT